MNECSDCGGIEALEIFENEDGTMEFLCPDCIEYRLDKMRNGERNVKP